MDTKYFTKGAIDNAAGMYTLYKIVKLIKDKEYNYTIEFVPFNGEESPESSGELSYLKYLEENEYKINTVINIDGVGHTGSENMLSFFNYDEKIKRDIIHNNTLLEGEQWYSSDHGIFALQNIPCIAVTSSDMFTDTMKITHTKSDTLKIVDIELLKTLSKIIESIIEKINEKNKLLNF